MMMDPNSGKLYRSFDAATEAGVLDSVAMYGTPDAIRSISEAVRAQHKKRRKAQKKARRANR